MDGPSAQAASPSPAPRVEPRRQAGVAAVLVAALASLPVLFFDALEGEGPAGLASVVFLFAAAWLVPGTAILHFLAPRPAREGLAAGGLVGLLILAMLTVSPFSRGADGFLFLVVIIGGAFAALSVGLGAVAGLLAARLRRDASRDAGRGVAVAAIVAGLAVLVAGTMMAPFWPFFLLPLAASALLLGGGTMGLMRSRAA